MATIRTRKQSDGTSRYTAIVRIRKRKTIIYQEYKTFALRTAAGLRHGHILHEHRGACRRNEHQCNEQPRWDARERQRQNYEDEEHDHLLRPL
jgi:hypothetical protein